MKLNGEDLKYGIIHFMSPHNPPRRTLLSIHSSVRFTNKGTNKLALILTHTRRVSNPTPIYLPPTQLGENKTESVLTTCSPFSMLMSCFSV